jgi:hypothetical protein
VRHEHTLHGFLVLRVRTSGWRIDRVSVVIADGDNHEFMIYHELFGGLSIMSLSQRQTDYHESDKFMPGW